jgi:hypothetical protein
MKFEKVFSFVSSFLCFCWCETTLKEMSDPNNACHRHRHSHQILDEEQSLSANQPIIQISDCSHPKSRSDFKIKVKK